jgi:hypothetical protein
MLRRIRRDERYALIVPLLYSTYWMHSIGRHNTQNHDTPAHRPRNHTLYDIPPIRFVFQVTQKDLIAP